MIVIDDTQDCVIFFMLKTKNKKFIGPDKCIQNNISENFFKDNWSLISSE